MEDCTKCGKRPGMHEVHRWWETPSDQLLCCVCNASDEGSDPADWHPGCIKVWEEVNGEGLA